MNSKKDEQPPDSSQDFSSLQFGAEIAENKEVADNLDTGERVTLERLGIQEKLKDQKSDRALRESYAKKLFVFLYIYIIGVFVILLMNGFPCVPFKLSDIVLTVLVGSNAVAALGLVSIVPRGLFKNR